MNSRAEEHQAINFRQIRDFSGVLNVTFAFLRQNFKNLARMIFILIGPLIVLNTALIYYFLQGLFLSGNSTTLMQVAQIFDNFAATMLLPLTSILFTSFFFYTTIAIYIRLYMEKGYNQFSIQNVFHISIRKVFLVFLLSIFIITIVMFLYAAPFALAALNSLFAFLAIMIGFPLIIAVSVYLSFSAAALLIEDRNIIASIYRSWELVKDNWWLSFGIIITLMIISTVLTLLAGLPIQVIQSFLIFTSGVDLSFQETAPVMLLSYPFLDYAQYLFYSILYIGMIIHFLNLVEKKEMPGLSEKLASLAGTDQPLETDNNTENL